MKILAKPVKVEEVEGSGLMSLLGEKVILLCANYFYAGVLKGVNDEFVLLEDSSIVYETGPWGDKAWKDAQMLGPEHFVMKSAIESFGRGK
jgi:hypothetical protein